MPTTPSRIGQLTSSWVRTGSAKVRVGNEICTPLSAQLKIANVTTKLAIIAVPAIKFSTSSSGRSEKRTAKPHKNEPSTTPNPQRFFRQISQAIAAAGERILQEFRRRLGLEGFCANAGDKDFLK